MKENLSHQEEDAPSPREQQWPAAEESNQNHMALAALRNEVSRRAYLAYVSQGSQEGHDMRHWQEAESQLLLELYLARNSALRNKNLNNL